MYIMADLKRWHHCHAYATFINIYVPIVNQCKSVLLEVMSDHTILGLILSRPCRYCLSRISSSYCLFLLLRGTRLFSPVSIQAFVLYPSQGDFSAVGRHSHENSSLDCLSLSASPTHPSSFRYHWVMCFHTIFNRDVKACFYLSIF